MADIDCTHLDPSHPQRRPGDRCLDCYMKSIGREDVVRGWNREVTLDRRAAKERERRAAARARTSTPTLIEN